MTQETEEISPQKKTINPKPIGPIGARLSLALTIASLAVSGTQTGNHDQGTESLPSQPNNRQTKPEET